MSDEDTTSQDPSNTDINALTADDVDPSDDVFNLIKDSASPFDEYFDPEAGESDKPTHGNQQ